MAANQQGHVHHFPPDTPPSASQDDPQGDPQTRAGWDVRWTIRWTGVGLPLLLWLLLHLGLGAGGDLPMWSTVQAAVQAAPRAQTLQETVIVTGTLGASPGVCAEERTLYLPADNIPDSTVYPCYTIQNSGTNPISVTITVERGADMTNLSTDEFVVAPGAIFEHNNVDGYADGTPASVTTARSFTATVFIQEAPADPPDEQPPDEEPPDPQSTTFTVINRIVGVTPQLEVRKTVGRDPDACSTENSTVVPTNGTAYFCITLENTGDITLTQHTLNDTQVGNNRNFAYTLAPSATLVITNSGLTELNIPGSLVANNLNGAVEHRATVNSRAVGGVADTEATGTASVSVSRATITLNKTVALDPTSCSDVTTADVPQDAAFYYCVRVTNTGEVPLTSHSVDEYLINVDLDFDYELLPGQVMQLTNSTLQQLHGLEPQLGPFFLYQGPNNVVNFTMRYTGTNEIGNVATGTANAVVRPQPTPTPTFTPLPRSMPTHTPFPTNTPTETPIPPTPTPTETPIPPTPTPTPTFTPDLRVVEVQTPTPTPEGGAPQSVANNQAATEQDSTEQGVAPDSPLAPGDNPTPTFTPTLTPTFSPTPTDTPPPTPTPTLTLSPTVSPTPTDTPTQPPTETPTIPPTLTPTATRAPTQTPDAVAVIIVTATATFTPTGDAVAAFALPPGQRPIVPPTPTPTPDTLMFLARTLDSAATTAVWIWFLMGSLVFFATAGIVAGLFFRQNERNRYAVLPVPEDEWEDQETWNDEDWERERDPRASWPRDLP